MSRVAGAIRLVAVAALAAVGCQRPHTGTGYVDANGARQFYVVHGDLKSGRTPLVILHGSLMSADAMAPLAERFARTRPVIALDAAVALFALRGGEDQDAAVKGVLAGNRARRSRAA